MQLQDYEEDKDEEKDKGLEQATHSQPVGGPKASLPRRQSLSHLASARLMSGGSFRCHVRLTIFGNR